MIRPVTQSLVQALRADCWPTNAAVCDFGLDTQAHYEAVYYPLRRGEVTAEQLDAALGDGPALTRLLQAAPSNPHKSIVFTTAYDTMNLEEEIVDEPSDVDQSNPVNMSAEAWSDVFARNPDALEHGD